ncbi:hypothetical protein GLOIN_2v1483623 [Rhizophagus irregularis DAOM 181602=DAOM 197198]|nr:hypothetical protein GLOIN_2v1483623 [Rhizophagus irregularis DAOM 181602=DAOM 197198]
MTRDIECGDQTYGEKISYVAISPDGSMVATFNPYSSSILITKVVTSETVTKIQFDRKKFFDKVSPNILGWSLAVSDIIDAENNIGLIAISCMTDEDMNPKLKILLRKLNRRIKKLFFYSLAISLLLVLTFWFLPLPLGVLFCCVSAYYCFCYVRYVTDIRQLTWNSSKGMIKLFKFSFNNINNNAANNVMTNSYIASIYKYCLGGVVSFLKNSNNSSNYATLVCMNCIKIQTIDIKLNKLNINIITREESDCILPGNLYKELESINDAKHNWIYLLKSSRYQEFLMVVTNEYQQTQNIEIYNVNTSQLVNVYHRLYGDEDFLVSNNSKPGIFAISTDSRLFAYSYGNNIITIYLMESGLEVVSKKFNNIHKIKFLEFIVKDRKLFIIEEDKENDVKFHIWLISGCLNDYFPISRDDLNLSDNDISTLLKYDGYYHILTKANGKIVTLKKDNEDQFRVLSDIFTKSVIFKENDSVIDEFKYDYSHDNLEPWNNSAGSIQSIRGKFLNNDKSLLYLIGWKSKSQTFKDFEDFKSFENSNLVYILISDSIKPLNKIWPNLLLKNKSAFFNVSVVEAVITSRWEQTKNYWMIPLLVYSTFLALFAYLPPFFLDGNYELGGGIDIINMINMGIFYYAGLYLLIAEFMQMKKYKTEYFILFNIFDLCSILLGIIVFTLTIVKSFDETNRINGEGIVILTTVTTLILWIEMIIPFFAFMFILTIGVGHSMLIFFGYPSLLNLNPTASNFTLNNETGNFTFTGESPNNPFDTIWDAILSAYYWNAIYLSPYNYWPLKLFSSL